MRCLHLHSQIFFFCFYCNATSDCSLIFPMTSDMLLSLRYSSFPLWLSQYVETLAVYPTFRFRWIKLRLSCPWHTLLSFYMIVVVCHCYIIYTFYLYLFILPLNNNSTFLCISANIYIFMHMS